ncbi:cell division protein ZapA [Pikeienuella piscinae]|uniref:Cell division protein ZapA n=1 Tax=Pikeienuella piscinae TaxID=2748098 RepID=A0A7L5BSW6_9RHOB|nr:cell division protein ZapA [Pikeienuella piscinae]QIE54830.1 cell division protein ZapA [Pikeienuella piscinae]
MAEVSVRISGRDYLIVCDDGQEARVAALARRIDEEATALAAGGGQITEARLLLMSALMLADKLDEAEQALESAPPPEMAFSAMDETEARAAIDAAAARLEALSAGGASEDA